MACRSQRNVWLSKLGGLSLDVLEDKIFVFECLIEDEQHEITNHNLFEIPIIQNFVKEWFRRDEIARIWVAGEK